ncbi:hypothetical protein TSAR_007195 [Trichomalopsis sarcophagae]|uniref:Uncharacterized protein n=1 Tax=Trichomalopsis sarcophagae TaxID=543379 RepID=A0A232EI16_9HYME|nr:hypothetical protein TSAR_007195 [Trichomalopsis sarcophagae]
MELIFLTLNLTFKGNTHTPNQKHILVNKTETRTSVTLKVIKVSPLVSHCSECLIKVSPLASHCSGCLIKARPHTGEPYNY